MDALYTRVRALMDKLFPSDKPRALILSDEVTKMLRGTEVNTDWDKMSGDLFSSYVNVAMDYVAIVNPWLLR